MERTPRFWLNRWRTEFISLLRNTAEGAGWGRKFRSSEFDLLKSETSSSRNI